MSNSIPSTQEINDNIAQRIFTKLNRDVPEKDIEFKRVIAAVLAIEVRGLYARIDSDKKQSLALTADEENLEFLIGRNYSVQREQAITFECIVTIDVTLSSSLPKDAVFESNNLLYFPKQTYSVSSPSATVVLEAEYPGTEYNLNISDTLELKYEIDGIEKTATILSINRYGASKQEVEDYRRDVLQEIGTVGGGGNNVDIRRYGNAVDNVYMVYPYSGRPDDIQNALPGEYTVFVEADYSLGTDGVPSSDLLVNVKNEIMYDPNTGETRMGTDITSEKLRVLPIEKILFPMVIYNTKLDIGVETEAKNAVEAAYQEHLKKCHPYVVGIDREYQRTDFVSASSVSKIISEVLRAYGGQAGSIVIYETDVSTIVTNRQLIGGELARAGNIVWSD